MAGQTPRGGGRQSFLSPQEANNAGPCRIQTHFGPVLVSCRGQERARIREPRITWPPILGTRRRAVLQRQREDRRLFRLLMDSNGALVEIRHRFQRHFLHLNRHIVPRSVVIVGRRDHYAHPLGDGDRIVEFQRQRRLGVDALYVGKMHRIAAFRRHSKRYVLLRHGVDE